ncbi:YeiH family putative sulfate export transporter [Streptococcus sp. X16XC17]|uniref:YeiH family protein n=1 Tax=Streptococcus sp. X16XC17 TaxID=2316646 RepID=UPI00103D8B8C|nr:YeiH family protein [Streptococcus sp. X16XC17]TCD46363.1 YeiH family putative sulfate export transporter [Streptococcus sp. X16XC17]
MNYWKERSWGLVLCFLIGILSHLLGKSFPIIGGAVFAILLGMIVGPYFSTREKFQPGIKYTSKKILQYAVILLGFGLNLSVVLETGKQSLPIILSTITVALLTAYALHKWWKIPATISTLIGVGSSICGGSAIAATAPVIDAKDEEVAQAISVIFFFNVLAALLFPSLGSMVGFSTTSGEAFGIFAGTAVNDTSSVTATAATWDSLYHLGTQTLDKAVIVKLTRTLAIIPITLGLAFLKSRKETGTKVSIKHAFPTFILFFILASLITTIATGAGVDEAAFVPLKDLSKFFIIMAMAAIGLNTNLIRLIKKGGRPILMGMFCWLAITIVTIFLQKWIGLI